MLAHCILSIILFTFVLRVEGLVTNVTQAQYSNNTLPSLRRDDSPCTIGQVYKIDCNTCKCSESGKLLCTKMACLPVEYMRNLKDIKHAGDNFKGLRANEADCVPGKIYKKGCSLCYCYANKKFSCIQKLSMCNEGNVKIRSPEDIMKMPIEELPELPALSSKCTPGEQYRIDCNWCLCLEDGNLLCTKKLCVSIEDSNKMRAHMYSEKSCIKDKSKIEELKLDCVECVCKDENQQFCKAIKDCRPKVLKRKHKLSLSDPTSDKCTTYFVYRSNCNKCYCHEGGNLRCTVKSCLNHKQKVKLQKLRLNLIQNGL